LTKLLITVTAATYLTLLRTILVPVFAVPAVFYGISVKSGDPNESLHWLAVGIFFVAAMTDYADGVIARRYNQRTPLGAFLDPFADKLLILTAIMILFLLPWGENWKIPAWFVGLVILRDAVVWGGIAILSYLKRSVKIEPHWTGKACTASIMFTVSWTGLKIIPINPIYPIMVTSIFLVLATHRSILQGVQILHQNKVSSIK
tara:strand:+ start:232 stop:840 length:609 start_codon:yes stop_codon:yes gene_type:complete